MIWVAEQRKAESGHEWSVCGKARNSLTAAKNDARRAYAPLLTAGRGGDEEFRIRTSRGDVYQVCYRPRGWRLEWRLETPVPTEAFWRGEYRAPGEDWMKIGQLGWIENAVANCQDWHAHSVHSGGVFRVVQEDPRGSIWLESHPPHGKFLRWALPQ